ncbi:MAG: CaiB/BaiF CoA transferase family protein [Dethiobacteria bacterium]|nr:CoA transferase [Bacillota bacterium]MDW7729722.1 CoA transferase [Bacillota bacterium]
MQKPLEGLKVVDLSRFIAGPYCAMKLGDMGAEVIKVESPGKGDDSRALGPPFLEGESAYYMSFNRNKKSITLNLREKEAREILHKLIADADVFVENFRIGVTEQMRLTYDDVKKIKEDIIYCSITGYGHNSPYREKPSFDVMIQGEAGLMSITGFPDGPPQRVGVAIADILGGFHAVEGILLALLVRQKTGKGQFIDVSLMDSIIAILTYQAGNFLATGETPARVGNRHPMITPYESFETSDGYVIFAVGNQRLWENFINVLGREDLNKDPRFADMTSRNRNPAELKSILEDITREKTTEEWVSVMEKAGVPCGRIRTIDQVLTDPHVDVREMVVEREHPKAGLIKLIGVPTKLSLTPGDVTLPPPTLGQHTVEILKGLGYSDAEVSELKDNGIV